MINSLFQNGVNVMPINFFGSYGPGRSVFQRISEPYIALKDKISSVVRKIFLLIAKLLNRVTGLFCKKKVVPILPIETYVLSNYRIDPEHYSDTQFLTRNMKNRPMASDKELSDFFNPDKTIGLWEGFDNDKLNGINNSISNQLQEKHKKCVKEIVRKFLDRRKKIDELSSGPKRDEKFNEFKDNAQLFFNLFADMIQNCSDRWGMQLTNLYNQFVEKDPDYLAKLSFPNLVKSELCGLREIAFHFAAESLGRRHRSNTHNYYRRELGDEFGIDTSMSKGNHAYDGCAVQSREADVKRVFYQRYSSEAIIEHLCDAFSGEKVSEEKEKLEDHRLTRAKFYNWITEEHSDIDAENVYDDDYRVKPEYVIMMLEEIGVFEPNGGRVSARGLKRKANRFLSNLFL